VSEHSVLLRPAASLRSFQILCRRRNDGRLDARIRVCGVVSFGIQKHFFTLFGILSQRLDDRHRNPRRRSASVVWCGVSRLLFALFGILCRRPDNRRRNAWCRSATVVPCCVPTFVYALFGLLCRRRSANVATPMVSMPTQNSEQSKDEHRDAIHHGLAERSRASRRPASVSQHIFVLCPNARLSFVRIVVSASGRYASCYVVLG
jgi:hypothetical protein